MIPQFFGNFSAMVVTQKKSGSLYNVSSPLLYTVSSSSIQYTVVFTFGEELLIFTKGKGLHYTSTLSLVTSMDLSNNGLSGDIPKELMKLTGLRFLNLSRNQLTGKIPKNIGGLGLLESLDLSLNKLSGEIPSSMSRLTFLGFLNLSYNALSGRIPSGNQLQTFTDPSIYIGNHDLCGVPLPIRCPGNGASQPISSSSWDVGDMDNGSDMIWFYMGMGPGLVAGFWGIMGVLYFKRSWRMALFSFYDDIWDCLYATMAVRLARWRNQREKATTS
ncbi:hypothetical protein QJS10_CPB21g00493 [Acorus calamus]|uniref:Uncharacterized protein n=1 Tax=Acorus calamus TaxID=4465 RepID=A0AAV9C3U2_ACOCL|nr:hypothetical protein QJS10_CPB21g00493 [Acorus calamus]